MPNISNLKPVVKITENQFKQLLKRIMDESGKIKSTAVKQPITGDLSTVGIEGVSRPNGFEPFANPQQIPIPDRNAQLPLPGVPQDMPPGYNPISSIGQTATRMGQQVDPVASDLIYNRVQSQQMGPSAIDKFLQYSEPVDKTMGRLYNESSGVRRSMDMPIAEARIQALQDPSLIPENSPQFSPVTKISKIGDYLTHERLKWAPIETATAKQARSLIQQAAVEAKVNITPKEANDIATVFADMWKNQIGGSRTLEGKMWENLRQGSKAKVSAGNAKDYFMQSVGRWQANPENFKRQYPRENKRLTDAWESYMGTKK